jgi:hypothetical protein
MLLPALINFVLTCFMYTEREAKLSVYRELEQGNKLSDLSVDLSLFEFLVEAGLAQSI